MKISEYSRSRKSCVSNMTLEQLLNARRTLASIFSKDIIEYMREEERFECYNSNEFEETEELAKKFLNKHARVAGPLRNDIYSVTPIHVAEFKDSGVWHKAAVYRNGAVVLMQDDNSGKASMELYVDQPTLARWNYPSKGHQPGA